MLAISIHAPVKGATRGAPLTRRTRWHFNPRSREGSDKNALYPPKIMVISIHAPVKGATCTAVVMLHARNAISIHAPVKGATGTSTCTLRLQNFNPRSREGSDYASITPSAIVQHFNPRSREGSDIVGPVPVHGVLEFQSTLP